MNLKSLSDSELLESARHAASTERKSTTAVLHHLREVEARRLFSPRYPSLHEYVVNDLKYSAPAAQRRIDAMRVLKSLPEVEERIESGTLNLTSLSRAQTFFRQESKVEHPLAPEEKREVLVALESKSTREVEKELLGRATEPLSLKRDRIRVVSETHSELKCLVTDEMLEDLERIRGLLGHKHKDLSIGEFLALIAKLALEKLDPAREPRRARGSKTVPAPKPVETPTSVERPASVETPASLPAPEVHSGVRRAIPAQTRREVWKRANGRCKGCGSVHRLQVDHVTPLACGGSNEIGNLRLLCFHCNQREADARFGRHKMDRHRAS